MEYMKNTQTPKMPQAITDDCGQDAYFAYVDALIAHMNAVTNLTWEWSPTGGGCDAMEWSDGKSYILITDAEGACVPTDPMRPVTVGRYTEDSDEEGTIYEFPTLSHALEGACFVQVDDPAGLNGEKRASFRVLASDVHSDGMASEYVGDDSALETAPAVDWLRHNVSTSLEYEMLKAFNDELFNSSFEPQAFIDEYTRKEFQTRLIKGGEMLSCDWEELTNYLELVLFDGEDE